jgi:hypothetical protein
MATRVRVLLTGLEQSELRRLLPPLAAYGLQLHHVPWGDDAIDLVLAERFDAIVVSFPAEGASLARFLSSVRSASGLSRDCGLVLLVAAGSEERARQLVGHGVNRVVPLDAPRRELAQVVVELLQVAPRVPLRLPTRILLKDKDRRSASFCQTVNLSTSGMLVAGFAIYPVGALLDFELTLPGDQLPLRGGAEIARHANPTREGVEGFGARFVTFRDTDRLRLEAFLSSHER